MLTAISNALNRFWNGPWIRQDAAPTSECDESDPDYDPAHDRELARLLAEEAYWLPLRQVPERNCTSWVSVTTI